MTVPLLAKGLPVWIDSILLTNNATAKSACGTEVVTTSLSKKLVGYQQSTGSRSKMPRLSTMETLTMRSKIYWMSSTTMRMMKTSKFSSRHLAGSTVKAHCSLLDRIYNTYYKYKYIKKNKRKLYWSRPRVNL